MTGKHLLAWYDALLRCVGLCRHGRYAITAFQLKRLRSTEREKEIEAAWEGFRLFAESMDRQMEQIEEQQAIYFDGRCYQLIRHEPGDADKKMFQEPGEFLKGHLIMKFKRWLSMQDEKEARFCGWEPCESYRHGEVVNKDGVPVKIFPVGTSK